MPHTGQCLCGAVTLSVSVDPLGARSCWCRACQKFGGGNGTTNAFFPLDSVQSEGELTWYESTADSGNTTNRAFCPKCGAHVFTRGTGAPGFTGIRVSIFDDCNLIAPQAIIWTESAPRWAKLDPDLPHHRKGPDSPAIPKG
jgi:hypothetical protein